MTKMMENDTIDGDLYQKMQIRRNSAKGIKLKRSRENFGLGKSGTK